MINIKRIYEEATTDDGVRILVDRLWPRGISRDKAKLNSWNKEISPSPDLRKWVNHDAAKYEEFKDRYIAELNNNPESAAFKEMINKKQEEGPVTLLYAAKDQEHNNAVVLKEWLLSDH